MKYYNLIETLKNLSTSHEVIQEFGEGDVYEYMNSGNHKYPCLFMTMSNINSDVSSTDYNFTLFYIDRLTDDNSNRIYVQSTGISVIKQVLQQIVSLNGDVELTSANYTLFTEKFADYCGGAFCEVVLSDVLQNTTNDTDDCNETDFGELQMTITKNGTYNVRGYSTVVVKFEREKPTDDLTLPYVTFVAEESGSTLGLSKISSYQTLEYSTDTVNWNTFDTTTTAIMANEGDRIYVRGILTADNDNTIFDDQVKNYTQFTMTGKIAAYGNCNAIWNYQDLNAKLFKYCGCKMFQHCESLTKAPELPATKLDNYCYCAMFLKCTSLVEAPKLPATTLYRNCYKAIFEYCSSLTKAPELPATTLVIYCYDSMFYGCTSLVEAPELPATTLAQGCYSKMFMYCSSLIKTPELPATTLVDSCYFQMFNSCSKLNKVVCLATDNSAEDCTWLWLGGVSKTGTFIKNSDMNNWTSGTSGIPSSWTVKDYVG